MFSNTNSIPSRWSLRAGPGAQPGWIGIDIGTHATKLVQLKRTGNAYEIATQWIKSANTEYPVDSKLISPVLLNHLNDFKELRKAFVGRTCAAALPAIWTQSRAIDVPTSHLADQKRMAAEEMAAELEVELGDMACDSWQNRLLPSADSSMARMQTHCVDRQIAQAVGNGLLAAGWECRTLDDGSQALSRAVRLSGLEHDNSAVLALDLSHALTTAVLVIDGQPALTRSMRGQGMQTLYGKLMSTLNITHLECEQLLARFGVAGPNQPPSAATHATMQVLHQPLQDLLNELKRTCDYMSQQARKTAVKSVCLFGGGALIRNMPALIEEKLNIPTACWSLSGQPRNDAMPSSEPLYGLATGLSVLAWEVG